MKDQFSVEWIDLHREPQCPANTDYPQGIDLDVSQGKSPRCKLSLPYPAKRCGHYYVKCKLCGINALVTTAGRLDDPRSITLPCKTQ